MSEGEGGVNRPWHGVNESVSGMLLDFNLTVKRWSGGMKPSTMMRQVESDMRPADVQCGAARPIDLVHLSKYTLGNRSLENELLGLFRSQADVYLARLDAAGDEKEWQNAAHSLKGSARGLGAWALATLAEEAEKTALAARDDVMAQIRTAIAAVNAFIDSVAEA